MGLKQLNKPQKMIGSAIGVVILAAICVGGAIALKSGPLPETSGDLVTIAKFTKTVRYNRLSEIDKMAYMKRLRRSSNELRAALSAGQITQSEYREAVLNGWMSRQLDHMEEYYSMPAATRDKSLTVSYIAKAKASPATAPAKIDPAEPTDDDEDDFIRARIRTWPIEQREQWDTYRSAAKAAKTAAKAASARK